MRKKIDYKQQKDIRHLLGRIATDAEGRHIFQLYREPKKATVPDGFSPYWATMK